MISGFLLLKLGVMRNEASTRVPGKIKRNIQIPEVRGKETLVSKKRIDIKRTKISEAIHAAPKEAR